MEARHGVLGRVWIADRGMASAENLAWLRETGRRYIIGAPKSELKKFRSELARREDWRAVREGVEVKLARHPETDETVILCRSADRRSKEHAMTTSSLAGSSRRSNASRLALRAQETARRGESEPTDRPHPPAKPARRRSLHDRLGA